jgi:F420-non-reducing hydrogenase iron-sulfur subunit
VSKVQEAAAAKHDAQEFEPKVVAFLCKWCSSAGSDLAGVSRLKYPANAVPIQVMCSGSVSPIYILSAFNKGNYYARRRLFLVQKLLQFVGVEPDRFRMSWVSAAEGVKYAEVITDFVKDLKALGPQTKLKAKR